MFAVTAEDKLNEKDVETMNHLVDQQKINDQQSTTLY